MVTAETDGTKRTPRGPTKPYPPDTFERCLPLPSMIHAQGFENSMRRVLVLQRLDMAIDTRPTQDLITNAVKYGLITGTHTSDSLTLTTPGLAVVKAISEGKRDRRTEFELAIEQIVPYKALYDRLQGKRLPALDVLESQMTGVAEGNRKQAASLFVRNARYLGLVYPYRGDDIFRSIEDAITELGSAAAEAPTDDTPEDKPDEVPAARNGAHVDPTPRTDQQPQVLPPPPPPPAPQPEWPSVHLDINIHIGADTTPELIEAVFASLAKHVYGK